MSRVHGPFKQPGTVAVLQTRGTLGGPTWIACADDSMASGSFGALLQAKTTGSERMLATRTEERRRPIGIPTLMDPLIGVRKS